MYSPKIKPLKMNPLKTTEDEFIDPEVHRVNIYINIEDKSIENYRVIII